MCSLSVLFRRNLSLATAGGFPSYGTHPVLSPSRLAERTLCRVFGNFLRDPMYPVDSSLQLQSQANDVHGPGRLQFGRHPRDCSTIGCSLIRCHHQAIGQRMFLPPQYHLQQSSLRQQDRATPGLPVSQRVSPHIPLPTSLFHPMFYKTR